MFIRHFILNKSLLYAFLWAISFDCFSQTSIVAGGGNSTFGREGEVSYSIGQTNYQFTEQSQGSIYAGAQQPHIEKATPTNNGYIYKNGTFTINVGPNPTRTSCQITTNGTDEYPYELTNLTGQIIEQGTVRNGSVISFARQAQGEYLLRIRPNKVNQNIIVFKIAKL